METKNAFLAILLSIAVLFGYQLLFPPQQAPGPVVEQKEIPEAVAPASPETVSTLQAVTPEMQAAGTMKPVIPSRPARDIQVETKLYNALISENGGTIKSFRLKEYREDNTADSIPKELVREGAGKNLPLFFSWGTDPSRVIEVPFYEAGQSRLATEKSGSATLTMTGELPPGLTITRTMNFNDSDYLIGFTVAVTNNSDSALQGSPFLSISNTPFSPDSDNTRFLFQGPAVLVDDSLEEVKVKDLQEEGPRTLQGQVGWAAYEDTYFMIAVAPESRNRHSVRLSSPDGDRVDSVISSGADIINPGASKQYKYTVYFGPKKMTGLDLAGHELNRSINFGWFGFVAKPLLLLLNFFYGIINNYGVSIILVTVLIKLLFWPITQKGMKSMKDMQKLQPKLAKIREKYKDDKERLGKEQMALYQTHKINPLGGCMPMVLQIPVFFALYRVLMQAIELRHAPFMLWISDLSAPERIYLGFDIPYLGGLPLLTLLMGASMFLQQKMSPTPASNPETAKIMMLMPVIFTFLFINFASGLVLYFFINNLLQMTQQHFINRSQN